MYADWQIKRWDTPVSYTESLRMISLVDDGQLRIAFEASCDSTRWQFTFDVYPVYRNILEEYRLGLWSHLSNAGQRYGWTFIVADSPWIASFRSDEPLLDSHHPMLQHFVICTEDDVVEILSPSPPLIECLKPTLMNTTSADKSDVLHHPKDRAQVDQLIDDVPTKQPRSDA